MKKIIALLLALLTLLSLCACNSDGKEEKSDNEKVNSETAQAQTDSNVIIDTPAPDEENEPEIDSMVQTPPQNDYGNDKVQKIGSMERRSFVYNENKKQGIISLDGKFDTGAIYYDVTLNSSGYYYARTKEYDSPENLDVINSINLVDPHGKTLITGFMDYSKVSDRFIAAAKAIEVVEGNGEYDYFLSGAWFALSASEGDIKYNADFYIFDLETNSFITSLKYDDSPNSGNFYGDFITYKDASGSSKILNANGYTVPDGAVLLYDTSDAYYKSETGVTGTVYDSQNNALFSYNKGTDYVPYGFTNGYFKARNPNGSRHVLLDKTGRVVSAEFSVSSGASLTSFDVYGNVILFRTNATDSKDQIYNFSGGIIAESANVLSCHDQNNFDKPLYYSFRSTKGDLIIVSTAGEILFEVHGDTSYDRDLDNRVSKKLGEDYYYFNLKDKQFNIKAQDTTAAPYLAVAETADGLLNIIDTTTGDVIIKGYSYYSYKTDGTDIYVYANNNGIADIYLVRF